jgi:hypothetical protein
MSMEILYTGRRAEFQPDDGHGGKDHDCRSGELVGAANSILIIFILREYMCTGFSRE